MQPNRHVVIFRKSVGDISARRHHEMMRTADDRRIPVLLENSHTDWRTLLTQLTEGHQLDPRYQQYALFVACRSLDALSTVPVSVLAASEDVDRSVTWNSFQQFLHNVSFEQIQILTKMRVFKRSSDVRQCVISAAVKSAK